ncbi:MAG TPA: hypothetical protein DCZ03_05985 [Gammaproteobacteria bacterium]|nr:hypothetical protein [Gammaproteobacteria bacterium]
MNFHELLLCEGNTLEKEKGEHVFMQGDSDKSLYFIQTGLLKAYYTSSSGKEAIKSFILPNDFIGSLSSIYAGQNCSFSLVSLETSMLVKIPFEKIVEYGKKDIVLANNIIEFLMRLTLKKERREHEFLCMSAEERYLALIESTPILLKKITQNDLARYLGMTPVGLSRIKKRVQSKMSKQGENNP